MIFNTRTDMACELYSRSAGKQSRAFRETLYGLSVDTVSVSDPHIARELGKPMGNYYTLSLPAGDHDNACFALRDIVARCLPERRESFLAVCLGNPNITPDALGALCGENILVTRHLKGSCGEDFRLFSSVALCRPGVLGSSGIESACQVAALCEEIRPDCVIAIDALAGADSEGLCRRVQISDAGIAPGSGVGNDRKELSEASLGIPVVSIGVPTVIDAGLLSGEGLKGMFVTPADIDERVRWVARIISDGVNLALHPLLDAADIFSLSMR